MKRFALTLLLVVALLSAACSQSKVDRFISALDYAQSLPALFGVTGEQAQLVTDAFALLSSAARQYRDSPNANTWQRVVGVFSEVKNRPSWERLSPELRTRIAAIFDLLTKILSDIQPQTAAGGVIPEPDFSKASSADLRQLENMTKRK